MMFKNHPVILIIFQQFGLLSKWWMNVERAVC